MIPRSRVREAIRREAQGRGTSSTETQASPSDSSFLSTRVSVAFVTSASVSFIFIGGSCGLECVQGRSQISYLEN